MQQQCCKDYLETVLGIQEFRSNSQSRIYSISLQCLIQKYLMNFEIMEQIKLWNFKLHKINEIRAQLQQFQVNNWKHIDCYYSNQFENNICIHEYIQECQQKLLEIDDLKDNYLRNILCLQDYTVINDEVVSQNLLLNDFIQIQLDQNEQILEQITRSNFYEQTQMSYSNKNISKRRKNNHYFRIDVKRWYFILYHKGYYSKSDNVHNKFQTYQERILKHHQIESEKQFYIQSFAIVYKQKADQKLRDIGLNLIEQALALNEDNPKYLRIKALLLYDSLRFEESVKIYDRAISLQPKQSQLYYDKGLALEGLNKYEEAINAHDQAILLNPSYSKAFNNKGLCFKHLQKYSDAIKMYDQALKFDPKYSSPYHNKGNALLCLGRYEEAMEMFDTAINLDPQLKQAYFNKGFSQQCLKQYEKSIEMYDIAVKIGLTEAIVYKEKVINPINLSRIFIQVKTIQKFQGQS